jgi:hypothetical protein
MRGFCEVFRERLPRDAAGEINRRTRPAGELATDAAKMSIAAYGSQPGDFCHEVVIVRAL